MGRRRRVVHSEPVAEPAVKDTSRQAEPCQQMLELRSGGNRFYVQCNDDRPHAPNARHRYGGYGTVTGLNRREVPVVITWGDA